MTGDPGTHAAAFGAHRRPHLHLHSPHVELCSKKTALALLCVAQFMVILDVSIVNVALPSVRRDRHVSDTDLPWVVGRLITGQQQYSGRKVAQALIEALGI